MKRLFLFLWLTGFAGAIFAGDDFISAIVMSSPLTINVSPGQVLHIRNFTQEGGTERGVVTVTINSQTANVLNAAIIDNTAAPPEIINQVTIAGPATVTVPTLSGATLFVTYRQDRQP